LLATIASAATFTLAKPLRVRAFELLIAVLVLAVPGVIFRGTLSEGNPLVIAFAGLFVLVTAGNLAHKVTALVAERPLVLDRATDQVLPGKRRIGLTSEISDVEAFDGPELDDRRLGLVFRDALGAEQRYTVDVRASAAEYLDHQAS